MKRNDRKRHKRYHDFLIRDEVAQSVAAATVRTKRKLREASRDLDRALSLNDEVEMKVPKHTDSRSHVQAMKKKIRKWKKTTELFMDLDS